MLREKNFYVGDEGNWARSRISSIIACAWLGNVEKALQEATRARDVFIQNGEYYWACVVDHNTAVIYADTGRHQEALKLYTRMIEIYPTLTDQDEKLIKRAIAMAQVNQAINLAWLGHVEQAYCLHQEAQASFIELGETSHVINSEIQLADLDYIHGYFGSALRRYYQARDSLIHNNIGNPMLLADLKLWMANCLVKLNRSLEACQLADEAVRAYRQLSTPLPTSNALREYATTLVASGRLKEALVALDEAWTLFNSKGFDNYAYATKLQQAELLLAMRSTTDAYEQARHVKEYFDKQRLLVYSIRASLVMAEALIEGAFRTSETQEEEQQSKYLEEAASLCKQITRTARRHNLQELVYKSQYLLGRLARLRGNLTMAAKYYRTSISQIELILDNLVYDLSPSFLHTTWVVYEDMIALCLEQGQAEWAFNYLERARSMALRQYLIKSKIPFARSEVEGNTHSTSLLQDSSSAILRTQFELRDWQEKYHDYNILLTELDTSVSPSVDREAIRSELKRCESKINELFERLHLYEVNTPVLANASGSRKTSNLKDTTRAIQKIDVEQFRRNLSSNQLLLAYYLYKGNIVIFAFTSEQVNTYEIPGGMEELERLLPLLHAHLDPKGWSNHQSPPMQSVLRLLQKLYHLLVAPVQDLLPSQSGQLTIVPYGPLHELPFHALHDGSHYLIEKFQVNYLPACNIFTHLRALSNKRENHLVDSEVYTKLPIVLGYSENGHLQRVRDEAQAIAALLHGNSYLEEEATIARLIEQAPGCPIIHIATHGQVRLDAPNFSYLRLADGQLNAIDAFGLDLSDCELVTLSGRETGLSLSGGGDEQLGLGRAFLAAGVASLVISLGLSRTYLRMS